MSTVAQVFLWGQYVGAVRWEPTAQLADFSYSPEFVKTGMEISPIVMPLDQGKIYRFRDHRDSNTFRGLPGLLADALPEKYGNRLLTVWMAGKGMSYEDLDPVARLCYVGERAMGALEFVPDNDKEHNKPGSVDLEGLVRVAREVMNEHNKVEKADLDDPNLDRLIQIGTSAGGAKAKALIAIDEKTGEIMSGQGEVRPGFTHYLLKLSAVHNDEQESDIYVGRMEMAYHLMAVEAGIHMMESKLITDKHGVAHFLTRRFDRNTQGEKYHVQTYCGIAHQDRDPVGLCSYEHLFSTARQLGVGQRAINELFTRMLFNVITRNQDDHSKNHAFLMDGNGNWTITPAYDICFSYKKNSRWIGLHQMQCNGKRDNFTLADIEAAAKAADIKNYKKYIKNVVDAVSLWDEIANETGLPKDISNATKQLFRKI